jgi:hypothetical protein
MPHQPPRSHSRLRCSTRRAGLRALVCLAIAALFPGDAFAQSGRGGRASRVTPIPGIPADLPPEHLAAIRQHFEDAIADRNKRRAAAGREGTALLRRAETDTSAGLSVHAGLKFLEGGKVKEAHAAFTSAVEAGAGTVWEREARIALFDMAIEHDLDPVAAQNWLAPLVPWATGLLPVPLIEQAPPLEGEHGLPADPAALVIERSGPIVPPLVEGAEPTSRVESAIAADILLRAALLDWMRGDAATAQSTLRQALAQRQALPAPYGGWGSGLAYASLTVAVAEGFSPTYGQRHLVEAPVDEVIAEPQSEPVVTEAESVSVPESEVPEANTPAPVSEQSTTAQLLRYADVLRAGGRPERTFEFLDTLLTKQSRAMTKTERSYALLRRAYA